jgi:hypothetical protein
VRVRASSALGRCHQGGRRRASSPMSELPKLAPKPEKPAEPAEDRRIRERSLRFRADLELQHRDKALIKGDEEAVKRHERTAKRLLEEANALRAQNRREADTAKITPTKKRDTK